MATTSRAERKRRRMQCLKEMKNGGSRGDFIDFLLPNYDLSRRSAISDISWADKELIKAWETTESKEIMGWMLNRVQRVGFLAEQNGQYGAAIGAYRLLYDMCLKENKPKKTQDGMEITTISDLIRLGQRFKFFGQNISNFRNLVSN